MKMREVFFLVLWLFLGLLINHTVFSGKRPRLAMWLPPDKVVEIAPGPEADRDVKIELKQGAEELRRGLKEGRDGIKQGVEQLKRSLDSLRTELRKLPDNIKVDMPEFDFDRVSSLTSDEDNALRLLSSKTAVVSLDSGMTGAKKELDAVTLEVPPGSNVRLLLWPGTFDVVQSDGDRIVVKASLESDKWYGEDFDKFAGGFRISGEEKDGRYVVSTGDFGGEYSEIALHTALNGTIEVPRDAGLSINGSFNDVTVGNHSGDISVSLPRGSISLSGNSGDASLAAASGKVVVKDQGGDLVIAAPAGKVDVSNVSGDATIAAGGEITANGIRGDLSVAVGSGKLQIGNVGGDLSIESAAGKAEISGVGGDASIEMGNGDLSIKNIGGDTRARLSNGNADIEDAAGDVSVTGGNSSVSISGFGGGGLSVDVGTGKIAFTLDASKSYTIDAKVANGSIGGDAGFSAERAGAGESVKTGDGDTDVSFSVGSGEIRFEKG